MSRSVRFDVLRSVLGMKAAGFPGNFWVLSFVSLLAFVSYDLIRSPVLPLFAESIGAGPEAVGMIVAASTITGILLKLPSGALSDLLGRARLIWIGLAVFALGPFFYSFVNAAPILTFLRFVHGLATAIFAPVAMAVVVDQCGARRGEALGWYSAFSQTGRLAGRAVGGYLLMAVGFTGVFGIAGIFGVAALVLFAASIQKASGSGATIESIGSRQFLDGVAQIASDRRILSTSGMEGLTMFAAGALMAFLPLFAIERGLSVGEAGLLFGAMGLASIVAKPVMGALSDRWGRGPLIVAGQFICAAVMFHLSGASGFMGFVLLAALFGLGEAVVGSSTSALVADLSRRRDHGSAMGVFGTVMDVGHAAGPLLSGFLIGRFGFGPTFTTIGFILAIVTVLFLLSAAGRGEGPLMEK